MIVCFQVAQQEAQRAAFVVDRAIQEKQQKIVQVRWFQLGLGLSAKITFYHGRNYKSFIFIRYFVTPLGVIKVVGLYFCSNIVINVNLQIAVINISLNRA